MWSHISRIPVGTRDNRMKPTFIALLTLCLCLGGCGKKEPVQPSATKPATTTIDASGGTSMVGGVKTNFIALLALFVAVGCQTTPKGINQTSMARPGTVLWEFKTGGQVESSPAIGPDGTVYVGSDDNKLYAIKTDSKGLAKSPWPMRGQNAQHTGRAK